MKTISAILNWISEHIGSTAATGGGLIGTKIIHKHLNLSKRVDKIEDDMKEVIENMNLIKNELSVNTALDKRNHAEIIRNREELNEKFNRLENTVDNIYKILLNNNAAR